MVLIKLQWIMFYSVYHAKLIALYALQQLIANYAITLKFYIIMIVLQVVHQV